MIKKLLPKKIIIAENLILINKALFDKPCVVSGYIKPVNDDLI